MDGAYAPAADYPFPTIAGAFQAEASATSLDLQGTAYQVALTITDQVWFHELNDRQQSVLTAEPLSGVYVC